ncbi:hypothetical protein [Micromonospora sp. NPDC049240]|uniref:hypothetical protein n=1 Tax=Micromonospora sp. NPDC049240 TaxID=3155151 RepID=UPI0033F4DE99
MTITLEKARELLAKAVETQGKGFVYNPSKTGLCYYQPLSVERALSPEDPRVKTGCLVGTALKIHGRMDLLDFLGSVTSMHREDKGQGGDLMDEEAADYFQMAQTHQDGGSTWGKALEAAEELAESLIKARSVEGGEAR